MTRWIAPLTIATMTAFAAPVTAQELAHLRGTIEAVDGNLVTLLAQDGESYEVAMAEGYTVIVYENIDISEVSAGDFLSIPSVESDDGQKQALSINVFPEAMRGTNEGVTAWDLTEDSLMTNATVGEVIAASDGSVITVSYGDTEEPILVPEGTAITRFAPKEGRTLTEGDQTVLFATQQGGTIMSGLAGVSDDGSLPPV